MTRENLTLAILFADIAKSTHLYEKLGDKPAKKIIGSCLSVLTDVTLQHNGVVIKTIGDELMCTFPSADDAIEAGMNMQLALEEMTFEDKPGFPPPNIYVGVHYGPVIRENNDVFGDAVNLAARMVAIAKQRQIITTEETVNALDPSLQDSANCIDQTTIKGKTGRLKIYEVIWEEHDLTVMLDEEEESPALTFRLEMKIGDTQIEVDESRPSVTLGRQRHNDVVVNDNRVSRSHARVEYRRGKFVLIDQSSNGTYLILQGKESKIIKRDEAQVVGSGMIGLGREVDSDSPFAVHFNIKM